MTNIKVMLQGCYGVFQPKEDFKQLVASRGYDGLYDINARTDEKIIAFIESNFEKGSRIMLGKESYQYVQIVEVDTSKKWTIERYDGAESIRYMDFKVVNEKLNYVTFNE